MSRETYIPTEQPRSQAPPRLPLADGHQERAESSCAPPGQGPQAVVSVTSTSQGRQPAICRVERLRVRREFLFVADGFSERRKSVVVQARLRPTDVSADGASASLSRSRIGAGFTATKRVGGAVQRNRAKRRLREAARLLLDRYGVAGADYVFIARRDTAEIAWPRLLDDVENALISLGSKLSSGESPDSARSGRRRPRREGRVNRS